MTGSLEALDRPVIVWGVKRLLILLCCATAALAETHYEIDVARAPLHVLLVSIETDCPKIDCDFQMPVWNALYQIRDFAQFVNRFEAAGTAGKPVVYRMLTPSLWRVKAAPGEHVRIRYEYFADSPGPFGCSASARHVFLNFAQILMYPVGRLREPASVAFRNLPAAWKIAVELPERKGSFRARNYDELVDAPVEMSAFQEADFTLAGKRMRVVVDGDPEDYNLNLLEDTARRVAATAAEIMQDVPFPSYTFIYHFRKGGRGGMEHANSCAIDAAAPCRNCTLAGVTAHEFFHLWNVKRIRPQSLEPIDYTRENITPSLWFSEGVTSTMGAYIQLQAGLLEPRDFLSRLESGITSYEQLPARLTQSAEEASIEAWLERYPFYERPGRSVSYYLKGELAGYLLDLTIRHCSAGRKSLDDLMRRLNMAYAKKGSFFDDTDAIQRAASEVAGRDLKDFFDAVVRSAAPIDWDKYLQYAGYRLAPTVQYVPTLGIETERIAGPAWVLSRLEAGGAAEQAGLEPGDRLVALDQRPIRRDPDLELSSLALKPGAGVSLEIERGSRKMSVEVYPAFVRRVTYKLEEITAPTVEQRLIRAGWLRGRVEQDERRR